MPAPAAATSTRDRFKACPPLRGLGGSTLNGASAAVSRRFSAQRPPGVRVRAAIARGRAACE